MEMISRMLKLPLPVDSAGDSRGPAGLRGADPGPRRGRRHRPSWGRGAIFQSNDTGAEPTETPLPVPTETPGPARVPRPRRYQPTPWNQRELRRHSGPRQSRRPFQPRLPRSRRTKTLSAAPPPTSSPTPEPAPTPPTASTIHSLGDVITPMNLGDSEAALSRMSNAGLRV